MYRGVG